VPTIAIEPKRWYCRLFFTICDFSGRRLGDFPRLNPGQAAAVGIMAQLAPVNACKDWKRIMKLNLFKKSKYALVLLVAFALPLISVGCGGGGAPEQNSGLEEELSALRQENQELQRLQAENKELARLRRDNEELKRLRAQTEALPGLQEENQRLRSELEGLKAAGRPPAKR
jgi:hypothetical protein